MNFFKSVFSNDPDPSEGVEEEREREEREKGSDSPNPNSPSAWDFGGLMKTIASKSESVIQIYKRDLEEFGSGLKKETVAIREAAARAVKELPGSLEAGASAAQEGLETVGQAIDEFGGSVWRGTAEIISHGKEALLDPADPDSNTVGSSKRYSRFEAQVLAIQSDLSTFAEEPEDGEEFRKWKSGFELAEKEEEIESLCYENGGLEVIFEKLVPDSIDYHTFWSRYYYRVHKLKQAEDARADLVKRAISREGEEEELSWEVDDDDYEEESKKEVDRKGIKIAEEKGENKKEEEENVENENFGRINESVEEKKPTETSQVENFETATTAPDEGIPSLVQEVESRDPDDGDSVSKNDDKVVSDTKVEPAESCKDSDFSVVSSQVSIQEEDDLGWDEIEDIGEHDDKKANLSGGSPNRAELRKRLSVAEDDEDLSWDIEDDDEPAKP